MHPPLGMALLPPRYKISHSKNNSTTLSFDEDT